MSERNEIQTGDAQIFDRLYATFAPRVLGYLMRLTGSRTEAEDLVQETFLAAYAGRNTFSGKSQPLAWLLGIARRRWRDERRRPQLETASLPTDDTLTTETDLAESVGRKAQMERALACLPLPQREAILLTAVQGLTHREAAASLGEPEGTIKWRIYEATRSLRRILQEDETKDLKGFNNERATPPKSESANPIPCRP